MTDLRAAVEGLRAELYRRPVDGGDDADAAAEAIGKCEFTWDEVPLEGPHGVEGVSATFNTQRFAAAILRRLRETP